MPSAHAASITIAIDDDPHAGSQLLAFENLYGSDSVAGSLITLASGQTIEIHAAGSWIFRGQIPGFELLPWPLVVTPRARLALSNSSWEHADARSVDNPSITLARRE